MGRLLYLDCFAGVSGDMLLGAFVDAGLPLEALRTALGSLALEGVEIVAERVTRAGLAATKIHVRGADGNAPDHRAAGHVAQHSHEPGPTAAASSPGHHGRPPHPHDHPPHHQHRTLAEIDALIARSALSATGQATARRLFRRLAEVEAAIHGVSVDEVHLHEVGALDSIVDIVGAVFAFEYFAADTIVASPLNVGRGLVACAHGTFPVPAPATLRLLAGVPIYDSGPPVERVTPTGALLVTEYATSYGPLPPMRVEQVGYGAGDRDVPELPNVVRLLLGRSDGDGPLERLQVVEFEVDDMNPQIFGVLMDRLYEVGALEVYYAPIQMKKNRPGVLVTVLAPPERREAVAELVFRETTTLGVRFSEVWRERLERELRRLDTPIGSVRIKLARRGGQIVNVAPEFEDCARLAAEHRLPVKEVQALVLKAYLDEQRRS
jgi:uncharacterized protein (TIGR00299 family) protein